MLAGHGQRRLRLVFTEPASGHPETLLVLYLGTTAAVAEACGRTGAEPVEPANPYWRCEAPTLLDPDGFPVALVPDRWSV